MSDIPLDETALQRTSAALNERGFSATELLQCVYDRELISTYLREAQFEIECVHVYPSGAHSGGFVDIGSDPPEAIRPVGPWVPVVQAESEEEE